MARTASSIRYVEPMAPLTRPACCSSRTSRRSPSTSAACSTPSRRQAARRPDRRRQGARPDPASTAPTSCSSMRSSRAGSRAFSSSSRSTRPKLNVPVIVLTVPQNPVERGPRQGHPRRPRDALLGLRPDEPHLRRPQGVRRDLVDRVDPALLDLRPEGRRGQDDRRVQPRRGHRPARPADRARRRQRPVRRPALPAEGPRRRPVDPRPADRPDRRIGPVRRPVARPVGHRHPARAAAHRDGRDDHAARPRQDPVAPASRVQRRSSSTCRARSTTSTSRSSTQADTIVEIVTYDSTTIHNTIAMAETFRSIGYPPSKVRYLVNRADSAGGISTRRPRARRSGGCPSTGRLRRPARRPLEQPGRAVRPRRAPTRP